jgi:hypothetical protein
MRFGARMMVPRQTSRYATQTMVSHRSAYHSGSAYSFDWVPAMKMKRL